VENFGRLLVFGGLAMAAIGALLWIGASLGLPFGRLPGDVSIQRGGFRFEAPFASMMLLSLVLTLVSWAISALRR
jgi:uncharacterized membrane-anchored protein